MLSANSCCVTPRAFLTAFILSFTVSCNSVPFYLYAIRKFLLRNPESLSHCLYSLIHFLPSFLKS
nr:MAG TPA: hypothetical protein [Caudoviricetes sp.]